MGAFSTQGARDAGDGGVTGKKRGDAARGDALRRTEMRRSGRNALSIDRFIKARKSTYDKRERIKRSRAEGAARRAKYERLQRKLAGAYERDDAFDPEAYERRLALIDNPELAREGTSGREESGAQEGSEEEDAARGRRREDEDDEAPEEQITVKGKKKKFDPVKKAREKAQVAREEREAQKKAFLEEKARRDAELAALRRKRHDKKNLMRKKTKRGQPVMKHRVQSILDKLTADASS